jgi:hypothetical protein
LEPVRGLDDLKGERGALAVAGCPETGGGATRCHGGRNEGEDAAQKFAGTFSCQRPAVADLCWPNVYRIAHSRMLKSFSASTSMGCCVQLNPPSLTSHIPGQP